MRYSFYFHAVFCGYDTNRYGKCAGFSTDDVCINRIFKSGDYFILGNRFLTVKIIFDNKIAVFTFQRSADKFSIAECGYCTFSGYGMDFEMHSIDSIYVYVRTGVLTVLHPHILRDKFSLNTP